MRRKVVISTAGSSGDLNPFIALGLTLKERGFEPLKKRKVAVITNHTGRDRDGNRLVDLLKAERDVQVVCLFSPEHGLYGNVDEKVGHGVDPKTGATRRRCCATPIPRCTSPRPKAAAPTASSMPR